MDFHMEKAVSTSPMAAILKAGLTKDKPQAKITSSFTQMAPFIADLSKTPKRTASENSSFTMDSSTQVCGLTESPMEMRVSKSTQMEANISEALLTESSRVEASIFGLMEKFISGSLKTGK